MGLCGLTLLITLCMLYTICYSLVYNRRCKLAKVLIENNFERTWLSNWVCLIEHESNGNTSAYKDTTRQKYYGLFQIPGEWCKPGRKGGKCNIKCEMLLNEDISDDSICALKIKNEMGFRYWKKWEQSCRELSALPDVHRCPEYIDSLNIRTKRAKRHKLQLLEQTEDIQHPL